jgi:hypothetical protein
MLRGSLRRERRYFDDDDANPMEGAINIVDAMLVFACGLMLSLVIYWNVDIQNREFVPMDQGQQVSEIEEDSISNEIRESIDGTGQYQRMGTVYVDPATGRMYLASESGGTDTSGTPDAGNADGGQEPEGADAGTQETTEQ